MNKSHRESWALGWAYHTVENYDQLNKAMQLTKEGYERSIEFNLFYQWIVQEPKGVAF
jgi:hypothetical protein